jgi:hypothetical protein
MPPGPGNKEAAENGGLVHTSRFATHTAWSLILFASKCQKRAVVAAQMNLSEFGASDTLDCATLFSLAVFRLPRRS